MDWSILLSPPLAFLASLGIAGLVYGFGAMIGAAAKPSPGKLAPYACGEEFPAQKFTFGYRHFFVAAIFFTIMHVAVLAIATVPSGVLAFSALGYLLVISVSIAALYSDID